MEGPNKIPEISWCMVHNKNCLRFIFYENLTEKNAKIAVSPNPD